MTFRHRFLRLSLCAAVIGGLAACSETLDWDVRGLADGFDTSDAVRQATAARPSPDARGVISYPSYQVAVARRGDTVADVAARVGVSPAELAAFNGVPDGVALRNGELLVLPSRVPGGASGTVDVAAIAGAAIDRSNGAGAGPGTQASGPGRGEPIRHRVTRGETAFSIARLYDVSPRALADWNGLGPDFAVREGQYLLIPVVLPTAAAPPPAASTPGAGTLAPVPPSSATPLPPPAPSREETAAAAPPSPDLGSERTEASAGARFAMPVQGSIIRDFSSDNDGIGIAASPGTAVRAAGDGTVAAITRDTDQVPILVLRHEGNLLTVYAGIDNIAVGDGDSVSRGQKIAEVRAASPSFLHFEVREGFESVDPMPYLQ